MYVCVCMYGSDREERASVGNGTWPPRTRTPCPQYLRRKGKEQGLRSRRRSRTCKRKPRTRDWKV